MKRRLRNEKQDCFEQLTGADGELSGSDMSVDEKRTGRAKKRNKALGGDEYSVGGNEGSAKGKHTVTKKRGDQSKENMQVKKRKIFHQEKDDGNGEVSCRKADASNLCKPDGKSRMEHATLTGIDELLECTDWTEEEYVSEMNNIDRQVAKNLVKLFKEDNTIPFIARYRKYVTNGMEADKLRLLKESFDQAKVVQRRAAVIIRAIDKLGKWTPQIHAIIKSTKHLEDLEEIYALYKSGSKRSLAERARELGLGRVSEAILQGKPVLRLSSFVDTGKEGLETEDQVRDGIVHIVSDSVAKDKLVFEKVQQLRGANNIEIQTCRSKRSVTLKGDGKSDNDRSKYEIYFDFRVSEKKIRPHQTLAINRAESENIIKVKVAIPDTLEEAFRSYCLRCYGRSMSVSKLHSSIILESIGYAYKKFIKPLIARRVRNDMKANAETASISVFATNVKQLLLAPPVRGNVVLGIDPGFYHGCKLAVVSETGNVLDTAVIYPHKEGRNHTKRESAKVLIELVKRHKCTLMALGNATACRETEMFVANLIRDNSFSPLNVAYTIVNEAGASVYSCSAEAKSEFPELDPNLISAISIARRLQDPLAELVKVEPKHLGVGMYQHDLPEKQLLHTLNEIVSEAVSFVGVDINSASLCLLKQVAGLNATRANAIIDWRNKHGPFKNREQILRVKGIGNKTFEQCAGFIRVLPETALAPGGNGRGKRNDDPKDVLNPLDQTWIHPESYKVAQDFLRCCGCDVADIGKEQFVAEVKHFGRKGAAYLANKLGTDETTVDVIMNAFAMRKDEDIRSKSELPVFRNGLKHIDDLKIGTLLCGVVRNVTDFGAFIDIGVGWNGLVPSKWYTNRTLCVGQRVEVKVRSVERDRHRIGLELERTL